MADPEPRRSAINDLVRWAQQLTVTPRPVLHIVTAQEFGKYRQWCNNIVRVDNFEKMAKISLNYGNWRDLCGEFSLKYGREEDGKVCPLRLVTYAEQDALFRDATCISGLGEDGGTGLVSSSEPKAGGV
ncbi:hypothetical protein HBI17_202770 [Parastagonospora nodorum]|nr:hypothetical protein HBI17_202770 [Parastagonospora nodorum]